MRLKLLAVLIVGSLLSTGAGGQEKGKTDEEKIQGTWSIESLEKDGKDATEDVKEGKMIFAKGKIKVQAKGKEFVVSYKLDPAKKPKEIDLVTEGEGGKERLHKGIYLLDGDTCKICFGDERPTEFTTQAGLRHQLLVLKRDKT